MKEREKMKWGGNKVQRKGGERDVDVDEGLRGGKGQDVMSVALPPF